MRNGRNSANRPLTESKGALLQAMRNHVKELSVNPLGERIYTFDNEIVILKPGSETVKVKRAKARDDDQGDNER